MENSISISNDSRLNITLRNTGHDEQSPKVVDVIIIGAGLSGLQAAVEAHKAGLSCLVLEATDRIGGKCFSVPSLPGSDAMIELGGAWINDTTESYMWRLGKRYGIEFEVQNVSGHGIVQVPGGSVVKCALGELPLSAEDSVMINDLLARVTSTGKAIASESYTGPISQALDKILFQEWIDRESNQSQTASWVMDLMIQALVGAQATEISALHMLRYWQTAGGIGPTNGSGKGSSLYLRAKTGAISFVTGLANELGHHRILLNSPVSSITQHQSKHSTPCSVSTQNGTTYHCRRLILSIPSPLYHKITFSPPLPPHKASIASRTKMGYYTKVVLVYSRPWWREADLNGTAISTSGPITIIQDTCVMGLKQYSLSTFMTGPGGREWAELERTGRMDAVLEHVRVLYGPFLGEEKMPEPLTMLEKDWSDDEWYDGAPSAAYPTNVLKNGGYEAMKKRFGHVHFVGTETSDVFEGYMEGAVRSGERGAKEVVEALQH